ncbi:MAG: tol-pal system protein YbgF [Deltaproteobacteria bacterium]|nr:tol-pal system protein YbgF [Deltaproteobacteria bacterium]
MDRVIILQVLCAVFLVGCAVPREEEVMMEDMRTQLFETRSALGDMRRHLGDTDSKLLLLEERVMETEAALKKAEVESAPPEGMRVVKLTDEPQKKVANGAAETVNKTPEAAYNEGQELFMSWKYAEARRLFEKFVQTNPEHTLADNALYWIGETYYSEKSFEKAVETFETLIKIYPNGNKAPDALLKAGYSYRELKQMDMAKETFSLILQYYPNTEAAKKAKAELERH